MNMVLSRRVALLTTSRPFLLMNMRNNEAYISMIRTIDAASSFESLPKAMQQMILQAEQNPGPPITLDDLRTR